MERYEITGMHCAGCAAAIEHKIGGLPGVSGASVNLMARTLTVELHDEVGDEVILAAVRSLGFDGRKLGQGGENKGMADEERDILRKRLLPSAVIWLLLFGTMLWNMRVPFPGDWLYGVIQLSLTIVVFIINRQIFRNGFLRLFRAPDMDSLVALGAGASFLLSVVNLLCLLSGRQFDSHFYFESGAMVVTVVTLGKYLESRARQRAGRALEQLRALTPEEVYLWRDGKEVQVPLSEVKPDDVVCLRPGSRIPVDGMVISGSSAIDESALTGESLPREVSPGDNLSAGTMNLTGALRLQAEKVGQETTLAEIIRLVGQSISSKSRAVRLADRLAARFVLIVVPLAGLTAVVWLLCGSPAMTAASFAISVLVVSCPCALGLATPVSVMVAMSRAATAGVLFKNGESLEIIPLLTKVFFDKTGTLTTGQHEVTEVLPLADGVSREEVLRLAAALEADSEHPLGKAICREAEKAGVASPFTETFDCLPGRGVSATIGGQRYLAGNEACLRENGIGLPDGGKITELTERGETMIFLADEQRCLGLIALRDAPVSSASAAVSAWQSRGIQAVMLTGDNERAAGRLAAEIGIREYRSGLLPAEKAAVIREAESHGEVTAMVGDGINDAPALAEASVGVAIGTGTDIAIDCADVVIMGDDPRKAAVAWRIAVEAVRNIRQNLAWAFLYNILLIPIAAGVLYPAWQISLNPMLAAVAMSCSSLCVVTNALRPLWKKNY